MVPVTLIEQLEPQQVERSVVDLDFHLEAGCHTKIALHCPLTRQPLTEPVVHPNGVSYEQQVAEEEFENVAFYPNRALKDYLDPTTDASVELQASDKEKKEVFYCMFTKDLLRDPVIDPEGHTYERHAIVAWIKKEGASPITRSPLRIEELYDNTTLLIVLIQEVQRADKSLNPEEIEDWKLAVSSLRRVDPLLATTELEQRNSETLNLSTPTLRLALEASNPNRLPDPPLGVQDQQQQQGQLLQQQQSCSIFSLCLVVLVLPIFILGIALAALERQG